MRRLLRQRGYRATPLNELLDEAGATNGSLYHHFQGGKEELAEEAIRDAATDVETALRYALEQADDPVAAIQGWVDAQAAGLRHDPRDGCAVAPTAIESASISEGLRLTTADAFASWTAALETALAKTRPKNLARQQARAVLSAIEGALLLDRTAHTTDHLMALREGIPGLLDSEAWSSSRRATPPRSEK
jgi:TetR/AcrR family transcriptional repressor of lmrAB and yxaGH operons